MASAAAYLDGFADVLGQQLGPFAVGPTIQVDAQDAVGSLEGLIGFPDGCWLRASLAVVSRGPTTVGWDFYVFHCGDRQARCVVRLDSTPHYPWFPTHPHHIHRGPHEDVGPHACPDGRGVVEEIRACHDGHGLPGPHAVV